MQAALEAVFLRQRHVVAQVVEAEFVVGAVGDVGGVGGVLVAVRHARIDHADAQAQPVVQLAHPCRVAAGQVVVDGDDVDALAFQRIEVDRQRGDEGLAFAGAHFGDLAQVQDHAADQLHVVVAHAEHALGGLAADGEGFRQELVERFAGLDALLELRRLGLEFGVGQLLQLRLEGVDLVDRTLQLAQQAFVTAAEDAGKQTVEHCRYWMSGVGTGVRRCARISPRNKKGRRAPFWHVDCSWWRPQTLTRAGLPACSKAKRRDLAGAPSQNRCVPLPAQPFSMSGDCWLEELARIHVAAAFPDFKCTCAPVDRPVEPALAISCPARTSSPTLRVRRELCA